MSIAPRLAAKVARARHPSSATVHHTEPARMRLAPSRDELWLDAGRLAARCTDALVSITGYSREAADVTVRHLIEAERAGKSCHGLVRLPRLIENGFGFKHWDRPSPRRAGDSLLVFDGAGAPGFYVLSVMLETAITVAQRTGICLAVGANVYPSGHLGGYARQAAEAGLVAHVESTSPSRMTAPGHGRPYLGTNPICRAFPVADRHPVVIDLATSAVTHGDLLLAEANGGRLPSDVAVRADGRAARLLTDFDPGREQGAILPFGQRDAYKAFALALGVALQASYGGAPPASPGGSSFGASVLLFDPQRLDPTGEARRTHWLSTLSDRDGVRIPGWMSVASLRAYEKRGIVPLRRSTWAAIRRHFPDDSETQLLRGIEEE